MHLSLWINAMLGFICICFADLWETNNKYWIWKYLSQVGFETAPFRTESLHISPLGDAYKRRDVLQDLDI